MLAQPEGNEPAHSQPQSISDTPPDFGVLLLWCLAHVQKSARTVEVILVQIELAHARKA